VRKEENNREKCMNEAKLIQDAQQGDTDAFKTLFEANKRKIYALAYQYTKNTQDTEDIFQDTFIKAFKKIGTFHPGKQTSFSAWVYRIGINCSIDHLRRVKTRRELGEDTIDLHSLTEAKPAFNPEQTQRSSEIMAQTEAVLRNISPRQRMVFILRHYQQMSIKEIAEYMDCTEGSVKKQLFRAVHDFKNQFKRFIPENSYEMQKI
jgi:RNA polymerase sigma-70 factor, ECF subfamily